MKSNAFGVSRKFKLNQKRASNEAFSTIELKLVNLQQQGQSNIIEFQLRKVDQKTRIEQYFNIKKQICQKQTIDNDVSKYINIKIMICVTLYSENVQCMKKTLGGIQKNLKQFQEVGINPNEILTIFMFDGIKHVNNEKNESVIDHFTKFDSDHQIAEQTLKSEYDTYCTQYNYANQFNNKQLTELRKSKKQVLDTFLKNKPKISERINKKFNEFYAEELEYIEQNIIDAMQELGVEAQAYLDDRKNSALVYYDEFHYYDEKSDENSDQNNLEKQNIMPILHVFKYQNGSKLSSHMWFFEGFCKEFQPDYCILMDVGAKPKEDAIFRLVMAMEADDKVGGVCGTMRIEIEEKDKNDVDLDVVSYFLINKVFSIQKCQSCEYDIAHILDKQAESALDFIHVLPGAFSGYRYKAFNQRHEDKQKQNNHANGNQKKNQNQQQISQPNNREYLKINSNQFSDSQINVLRNQQNNQKTQCHQKNLQNKFNRNKIIHSYLRQVIDPNFDHQTIEEANMFLAEDRVLCSLLYLNGYYLRYIQESIVYVDAQISLKQLLLQRRRWINGSWFALQVIIQNKDKKITKGDEQNIEQKKNEEGKIQGEVINENLIILEEKEQQILEVNNEGNSEKNNNQELDIQNEEVNSQKQLNAKENEEKEIIQKENNQKVKSKNDESKLNYWDNMKYSFSLTQAKFQSSMIYFMQSFQTVWVYMIMYSIVDTGNLRLDNFIVSTGVAFYVFLILSIIYLSLNYDSNLLKKLDEQKKKEKENYYFSKLFFISTLLGFISLYIAGYTLALFINFLINSSFNDVVQKPHVPQSYYLLFVTISTLLFVLPIILSLLISPRNIAGVGSFMFNLLPYIYYQPTYSHLFVIYSFCRIDDLSWGTKGLTENQQTNSSSASLKSLAKFYFVSKWLISNVIVATIILSLFKINVILLPQGLLLVFSVILTGFTCLKGFLAVYYKVKYYSILQKTNQYIDKKKQDKKNKRLEMKNIIIIQSKQNIVNV